MGEEEQDFLQQREIGRLVSDGALATLPCRSLCRHGKRVSRWAQGRRCGSRTWESCTLGGTEVQRLQASGVHPSLDIPQSSVANAGVSPMSGLPVKPGMEELE